MFKRLKTSLTNPPQTVMFIKDSWWRIVGYILLVPFLLTLPLILRSFVTDSMSNSKYQALITVIQEDFRSDQIVISDGVLTSNASISAQFDYLTLVVGRDELSPTAINILFEEEDIVMILSNMEVSRVSYASLELTDHDFSSSDLEDVKTLAFAVKRYIESQDIIFMTDFMQTYIFGVFDYLFYVLMLSLLSMFFISRARIPMKYRFKLSVYLSTVIVVLTMISILFGFELGIFSFFVGYIYHIWAYRFIKIIDTGGI
ncbi:MAG: DUF1189 family protein [Acholeplasmataceae bacterium]|jgi:hypothetical protein|nr:DUF1189 family protein [Acholeplasmataceae bacterium]